MALTRATYQIGSFGLQIESFKQEVLSWLDHRLLKRFKGSSCLNEHTWLKILSSGAGSEACPKAPSSPSVLRLERGRSNMPPEPGRANHEERLGPGDRRTRAARGRGAQSYVKLAGTPRPRQARM